jgi:type IV secretion system protein TrbL
MVVRGYSFRVVVTLLLVILVATAPAHAQSVGTLDQIVSQFQTRSSSWEGSLRSFALNTFGILAAIELAWAGIRLAFRGSDVSEWLAEIVNQILFLGFFSRSSRTPSHGVKRSSIASGKRRMGRVVRV